MSRSKNFRAKETKLNNKSKKTVIDNKSKKFTIILLLLIFVIMFQVYFKSPMVGCADTVWTVPASLSLIHEGNLNLDEYAQYRGYYIENVNNHYLPIFPIGVPILAAPFIYATELVFPIIGYSIDQQIGSGFPFFIERLVASIFVALSGVFIFLITRLFVSLGWSLTSVFIYAFCTSAWSMASRALWQHGPSMLMLSIALYLILLSKDNPKVIQYSALPLAFSYVIRPTNSISYAILTMLVFLSFRKYFIRYLLWSAVIFVPFVLYNVNIYGALLSPYYMPERLGYGATFLEALAGNLISPARGLFIFSPIFLASVVGIGLRITKREMKKIDYFLILIIFFHWISISSFPHWWGGFSYGPRFFSDMIPFLIYFMLPTFESISSLKTPPKVALICLLAVFISISAMIHYQGATDFATSDWNGNPESVDEHPERIWNWLDPSFLRYTVDGYSQRVINPI